ncbi:MAG: phosphohydrolase [Clostridiales bacterium]|nr:phosphohydrolase [Roseburia sp.]MDD7638418.1 phosphohydrolase [Clostridiales bacterium]MDY4112651.1 phosphohydrolase [Roseburia sp.]
MADYITTFSKIHFTPLAPRREDIIIEDIAHALSLMTRANGHFPEFYSVAQHCMDCAMVAEAECLSIREQLACLLHDASEAYLSDITRPVKANLTEYRRIEKALQDMIYEKYLPGGLTEAEAQTVKRIDDTCLYYEFEHFMGERLSLQVPQIAKVPEYKISPFREAEEAFLKRFYELTD